ncbi:MAG TPA: S9 family peptidase [Candidatus Acidoferrales bacterium]|nr:S9 family peptidase [Candidatus Acidoferrales bacterium]
MRTRLAAILLFCFSCSVPDAAAAGASVTAGDFKDVVNVGTPAMGPGGKLVATVVSRTVWNDDRSDSDLVTVDLVSHRVHVLVRNRKGLDAPQFSPDGTSIAFLADAGSGDDAHAQLFVIVRDGGVARQITHAGADVDEFAWRPDGRAFAFAATDPEPKKTGAARFEDSFIFTTEPIVAHSAPQPDHLYTIALAGGTATQLTFGTHSDASPSWSPDGKTIAYTQYVDAILNDQNESHAELVDVATKAARALTGRTMWEVDPIFAPDGKHIAYLYTDGDSQVALSQLYVTTPAGGAGTEISGKIDRPIGDAVWSHDSKTLIATAPDGLTNGLYRISLDGTFARLRPGDVTPGIPLSTTGGAETPELRHALASDGTLAFVGTWTAQPPELFALAPGAPATKISDFNAALSQVAWSEAEPISFPTTTGVTGDGLLYLPPGFTPDRKYPVVVFIHGGPGDPTAMTFDFWAQVMAARGWLVLRPNYRGSPNLGYAYQHAILYDPEDGPGKDIVAALDAVRARGIVDEARIAVSGWSYGGIMTAWLISKYHFWRAAVSGASVNDWITDYGTADDSSEDLALLHGSPFVGDNAAEWRAVSAISYVADVTTPVLILSDVGDNRDPFATSSMYWRALRDNHKDATLRVWPIAGHFPSDPVRIADIYHYWIDYIADRFR